MISQLIQTEFSNMIEVTQYLDGFQNLGKFYYAVLENLPGNISVITTENKFVYVNEPYADFFHLKTGDFIGKHIEQIFPPDMVEVSIQTDADIIQSKKTSHFSHKTPLENGDYFYTNVTKFPFIKLKWKRFCYWHGGFRYNRSS